MLTRHRGIDLDLSWTISETLTASLNAAYADHTYDSDIQILGSRDSIQGNDIDTAPRHFGSARLTKAMTLNSRPASIELEQTWVDKYYIDPNNQHSYPGHELVNARAEWLIRRNFARRSLSLTFWTRVTQSVRITALVTIDTLLGNQEAPFWVYTSPYNKNETSL